MKKRLSAEQIVALLRQADVALGKDQKENARLKRIVGDQALDLDMLREVARGNF